MITMVERASGGLFECGSCDARFVFEDSSGDCRFDEPAFCPVCGVSCDTEEDSLRRGWRRWLRIAKSQQPKGSQGCQNRAGA